MSRHPKYHSLGFVVNLSYKHKYHHKLVKKLQVKGKVSMTVNVTVGHQVNFSIVYLDQNGNPMQTTPTPDSIPVWSDVPSPSNSINTFTPASTGVSAVLNAAQAGSETVGVEVVVGGQKFDASVQVLVAPPPQVLSSVAINSVVN